MGANAAADDEVCLVWSARGLAYVLGRRGVGKLVPPAAANGGTAARVELRVAGGELRGARWVGAGGEAIPEGREPRKDGPRP